MISIVIPTYEQKGVGAAMLTKLLQSIAMQVITVPYEIVISDNSSDDAIKKVALLFSNLPIVYYRNPVRGASENINKAIDLAKYDYVKLMMQDDVFLERNAVMLFVLALDSGRGWVISNSKHINDKGIVTGQRTAIYEHGQFDRNTVGMPSVIAFRKCDLRFDTRLKTFCDLYFYYQLFELYGPPMKILNFVVGQRFHSNSLSRSQAPSHEKDKNFLLRHGMIKGKAPKVVVAVVVYDRVENVDRWIECWKQCETHGAELVFIHNSDKMHYSFTEIDGIKTVVRQNIGYDIGAMQDVFKERLPGFPNDWNFLLWCTDDTVPMVKDFISPFIDSFNPKVGITCMQISDEVARHVRTTGFCIPKAISRRIKFPADPITTRQQCLGFEHADRHYNLYRQIFKLGLRCVQVAEYKNAPLYDMNFWSRNEEAKKQRAQLDRMAEHNAVFNFENVNV